MIIHCSECGFSCSLKDEEKLYPNTLGCLVNRGDPILGRTQTWENGFCDSAEPRSQWIYKEDYHEEDDVLYMYIKDEDSYCSNKNQSSNTDILLSMKDNSLVGFIFYHAKELKDQHSQFLREYGYTYYPFF